MCDEPARAIRQKKDSSIVVAVSYTHLDVYKRQALPGEHYLVEDHVADKRADVGTHQGVFGVFRTPCLLYTSRCV